MNKVYISNAFSFNMIAASLGEEFDMECTVLNGSDVKTFLDSSVGQKVVSMSGQATCDLFKLKTGVNISADRNNITLVHNDVILVMQYNGPRLEEGLTDMPKGGNLKFYAVRVFDAELASSPEI